MGKAEEFANKEFVKFKDELLKNLDGVDTLNAKITKPDGKAYTINWYPGEEYAEIVQTASIATSPLTRLKHKSVKVEPKLKVVK